MADLQPLLPRKIAQSVFPPIGDTSNDPPMLAPLGQAAMGGGLQSLLPAQSPNVTLNNRIGDSNGSRQSLLEADLYKRENPIAPTTTLGKIGHVAAGIGNVLGNIFAPATMALIPGTELHSQIQKNRDIGELDDISSLQTQADQRKQTEAQTAYTTARPAIEKAKLLTKLAPLVAKGYKPPTFDDNGELQIEEDPNSQAYKDNVALASYRGALQDRAQVQADNQANHYMPGTPQFEENQRKLAQIDTRLHQSLIGLANQQARISQGAERLGFDEDKTYNPQPTATERSKGDLAQSAVERVQEMKQIVAKHPEYFGPVAGRAQNAQNWIGSSDPDAVTYNSAAQYLADHSAGVFGGRGEYITRALHGLTDPKYTPEGLNAALNEAEGAARGFVAAGTTHAKGVTGNAASRSQPPASAPSMQTLPKEISDAITEGHQATLSDGSVWKKVNGKVEKIK